MNSTFLINRRNGFKMTQAEVARLVKVSRRTYIRWEDGDDIPTSKLVDLGRVLKFKVLLIAEEAIL